MPKQESQIIAAIDLGTNSAHLVVAEMTKDGIMAILDTEKDTIKLGEGFNKNFQLSDEVINRTSNSLASLKEIATTYTQNLMCIATYASRTATNKKKLLKEIEDKTGIKVRIISGKEEARLFTLGIQYGFSLYDSCFLGIDIGGGSTEISVSDNGKLKFSKSIDIGAVTLSKQFFNSKAPTDKDIRNLSKHISDQIKDLDIGIKTENNFLCSGTAKTLAFMDASFHKDQVIEDPNGYLLTSKSIRKLNQTLLELKDPKEIKNTFDIDQDRANIILAGSEILTQLSEKLEIEKWHISKFGLREGIVVDSFFKGENQRISQPKDRWDHIIHLGEKFGVDKKFANSITKTSEKIFDQLKKCNDFQDRFLDSDKDLLLAASFLHESGKQISHPKFHKHSHYLVSNSRILGYSLEEKVCISLIIRLHRKGTSSSLGALTRGLSNKIINKIKVLSSILRISTALNRTRRDIFKDIKISQKDNAINFVIEVKNKENAIAEISKIQQDHKAIIKSLGTNIKFTWVDKDGK